MFVEAHTIDMALTKGFNRPILLRGVRNIATQFGDMVATSATLPEQERRACLVGLRVDPARVAASLMAGLTFSIILGTMSGVVAHNAELGVAVGSGLGALVLGVQGLLVWLLR